MVLMFLIISMHLLIEKCFQLHSSTTMENGKNQNNATEPMTHLITPSFLIIFAVLLISSYLLIATSLRYLLNIFASRYIVLLRDSAEIILSVVLVLIFHVRNPHLRNFIIQNTLFSNSIQPQENQQIQIELETI